MKDGPLKAALEDEDKNIIMQKVITYRIKDGMLIKETIDRKFYGNDYIDSTHHEPIVNLMFGITNNS